MKELYSTADVKKGDEARDLYIASDTPSKEVYIEMLSTGCIQDSKVQIKDFMRASHIYGPKVSARHEYALEFGDCQVYDDTVTSNNIDHDRTIDYPKSNRNKSWVFILKLTTGKRISKSSWTKIRTTDVIIK